eukprot:1667526-Rhodomonas_salina.1
MSARFLNSCGNANARGATGEGRRRQEARGDSAMTPTEELGGRLFMPPLANLKRRGEERRGEARRGEERRGEARRGEERRGKASVCA